MTAVTVVRAWVVVSLALVLGACEAPHVARTPPPVEEARVAGPARLSPDAARVYRRTLVRDPAPSCEALVAGVGDPALALLELTEHVHQPPSSPMRAARCLVRDHALQVEATLLRWARERRSMGFGLLVLNHLEELPPSLRARFVDATLDGQYADVARPRVARAAERDPSLVEPSREGGLRD